MNCVNSQLTSLLAARFAAVGHTVDVHNDRLVVLIQRVLDRRDGDGEEEGVERGIALGHADDLEVIDEPAVAHGAVADVGRGWRDDGARHDA